MTLVTSVIVLWNTFYMERAVEKLREKNLISSNLIENISI
jgi:TnpA family transposase